MSRGSRLFSFIITSIHNSFKRFPITMLSSITLMILLIRLNELSQLAESEIQISIGKMSMAVALFAILSLCIGLFVEDRYPKKTMATWMFYVAGAAFAFLYRVYFLEAMTTISAIRYTALMLFLAAAFFYLPRLRKPSHYEIYVIKVFNGALTTWIYSVVLYVGISAILFTINTLFDLNIPGKYFYYSFLFVAFIFAVATFLARIPETNESHDNFDYSKALKVLLLYIVIPLITIYTLILYVYFAKILITWEWPQGLVSHLVLWYTTVTVGVIFLITPILKENPFGNLFKIWFPKVILPIMAMMFVSIGLRINQYGFTENRYFVVLLGIWVTLIMIYFSFSKPLRNIFIPITLSIFILVSAFGPLSSYSVSINSQTNRFVAILEENDMINNGQIVAKTTLPQRDRREISNILSYFQNTHELNKLKILPDDFELRNMKEVFGFEYAPEYPPIPGDYFNYYLDLTAHPLDIQGFDYYFIINSWSGQSRVIDRYRVEYTPQNQVLKVFEDSIEILSVELRPVIEEIHRANYTPAQPDKTENISVAAMTVQGENSNIRYRITFTAIYGQGSLEAIRVLENAEFILLLDIK